MIIRPPKLVSFAPTCYAVVIDVPELVIGSIVDLLLFQQQHQFGELKSVWIDTSNQLDTDSGATVISSIFPISIKVNPKTQGNYPLFAPFVTSLAITAAANTSIILMDYIVPPSSWSVK